MSAIALFTWLAIAVLVGGSLAVFCWFLMDAVRVFRSTARRR